MRRLLLLPLLLVTFGCAQNYFNVPKEQFADKVKVLGIAPLMVDADSTISHPQREQLIGLLADTNRINEQLLVRKLKATGNFYTVALLDGDPQKLISSLMFRREKRDDATIQYNKYFWKGEELRSYLQKNSLDAVMLVVVSGINRTEKIFSTNLLNSLETDYNFLIMTAQIVDANGTVLWEYPNFRRRLLTYYPMLNLQYPDFSEAEANLSDKAQVKFKTFEGIRRSLEQKRKDLLMRETQETEIYGKQFDEMITLIRYDRNSAKQEPAAGITEPPKQPAHVQPAAPTSPEAPRPASATPVEIPKPAAAPAAPAPSAEPTAPAAPPVAAPTVTSAPPAPPADATGIVKGTTY